MAEDRTNSERPSTLDPHEQEARYRALVEHLPAVVYQVAPDDDRRTMYVSSHVETALGYSREEWLEQPDIWMELLHPDDREPTLAAHDHHNETGEPWSREYRLIASDGRIVWFRDVATLVRDRGGEPRYWLGVQLDITELKRVEDELRAARDGLERRVAERTAQLEEANAMMALEIGERRRAEAELRQAEQRYRALAEQIPAVTYIWECNRPEGEEPQYYTSPRIEQILGFTVEEWHRDDHFWISRLHPDDRTDVLAATLRSESTGSSFSMEYRFLHRDGRVVWVADQAALLSRDDAGRPRLFQGVMLDVTARKQAEARAAETEFRYRDLAEQVPGVIYIAVRRPETDGYRLSYVSPQVTTILGFAPSDWEDTEAWLDTVHADDRDRVLGAAGADLGETGWHDIEYRVVRPDGEIRWVRDRAHVLSRDALGRPQEVQGLVLDVTDARALDHERWEAEERYRSLVEAIPAMVYLEYHSPEEPTVSRFAYVSPQVETILGYTQEEALDPDFFARTLHPDDRDRIARANARADLTGTPFDQEFRQIAKDGTVRWMHDRAVLVRSREGEPRFWHGVTTDITARKQAEENLQALEDRYRELIDRLSAAEDAG